METYATIFMNMISVFMRWWMLIGFAAVSFFWLFFKNAVPTRPLLSFLAAGVVLYFLIGLYVQAVNIYARFKFDPGTSGILVLNIEGDDTGKSIQRNIVSSLNNELSLVSPKLRIEAHGCEDSVDESRGAPSAHKKARRLGQVYGARLVVWGSNAANGKFFPRITLVDDPPTDTTTPAHGNFDILDTNIKSLPADLTTRPVFLAHFASAYIYTERKQYDLALPLYESALKLGNLSAPEMSDLLFYTAKCYYGSLSCSRDKRTRLLRIIDLLKLLAAIDTVLGGRARLAATLDCLGVVYVELPDTQLEKNLQIAITKFESALDLISEHDDPLLWASIQGNIGAAYYHLASLHSNIPAVANEELDKSLAHLDSAFRVNEKIKAYFEVARVRMHLGNTYLRFQGTSAPSCFDKAISSYELALSYFKRIQDQRMCTAVMNDMGEAYQGCTKGNSNINQQKALDYFQNATNYCSEEYYPEQWAQTHEHIGDMYESDHTGAKQTMLDKAILEYQYALHVFTETEYPLDWARLQSKIGHIYCIQTRGNHDANYAYAVRAFESALKVITIDNSRQVWIHSQHWLGGAYHQLAKGGEDENLAKSIKASELALAALSETDSPDEWAMTQCNLATAYLELTVGDVKVNLKKARTALDSASRVFTEKTHPVQWPMLKAKSEHLLSEMSKQK